MSFQIILIKQVNKKSTGTSYMVDRIKKENYKNNSHTIEISTINAPFLTKRTPENELFNQEGNRFRIGQLDQHYK